MKIPLQTGAAAQDVKPRVQAPLQFLLALPVAVLPSPIENFRPHH